MADVMSVKYVGNIVELKRELLLMLDHPPLKGKVKFGHSLTDTILTFEWPVAFKICFPPPCSRFDFCVSYDPFSTFKPPYIMQYITHLSNHAISTTIKSRKVSLSE